jgi:hypothetical protein
MSFWLENLAKLNSSPMKPTVASTITIRQALSPHVFHLHDRMGAYSTYHHPVTAPYPTEAIIPP